MTASAQAELPTTTEPIPAEPVARFCADGIILLEDRIEQELLDAISAEWSAFMASSTPDLLPADAPAAMFWRHVRGEKKRMRPLQEFPALEELALGPRATNIARQLARASLGEDELRLLETIVFSKPPGESGLLMWHQDTAYFPFEPQNQLVLWVPLDAVDAENGSLEYATGTHKLGLRCPVDLHTGERMGSEACVVPPDPEGEGHPIASVTLAPGDLAVHDGRTWHRSLPNVSRARPRRAISLRYLVGETRYAPRPGTAQSMRLQAAASPGHPIAGDAFPRV